MRLPDRIAILLLLFHVFATELQTDNRPVAIAVFVVLYFLFVLFTMLIDEKRQQ